MNIVDVFRDEFLQESHSTRKMLERAPADRFGWKPHEKSMTLGVLVNHIAEIPQWVGEILKKEETVLDLATYTPPNNTTTQALLAFFDENLADAGETMLNVSNEHILLPWRFKAGDKVIFEAPRLAVLRSMVLNHTFHHRGQLSVYLRLLNVALPPVYGPTADEQPEG